MERKKGILFISMIEMLLLALLVVLSSQHFTFPLLHVPNNFLLSGFSIL